MAARALLALVRGNSPVEYFPIKESAANELRYVYEALSESVVPVPVVRWLCENEENFCGALSSERLKMFLELAAQAPVCQVWLDARSRLVSLQHELAAACSSFCQQFDRPDSASVILEALLLSNPIPTIVPAPLRDALYVAALVGLIVLDKFYQVNMKDNVSMRYRLLMMHGCLWHCWAFHLIKCYKR